MNNLTVQEIAVLEMMAGRRPGEWGAWVGACLESLKGAGYCTPGPRYQITAIGQQALDRATAKPTAQEKADA